MTHLIPIETVKPGQTLMVTECAGRSAYLIHDVESRYEGEGFIVTYGTESGRWTDTVSFEAGELAEVA